MSTLSIDLQTSVVSPSVAKRIEISHLVAYETHIGKKQSSLKISPGVVVAIPVDGALRFLVDTESFDVQLGSALMLKGQARTQFVHAIPSEDTEDTGTALHVIEINALIDDSHPLREELELPRLLNHEKSETVSRLYDQLTLNRDQAILGPNSLDFSRHIAATLLTSTLIAAAGKSLYSRLSTQNDDYLPRLKQFLFGHINSKLTPPDMAAHLGMSNSAFYEWAQAKLGYTPALYYKRLRLEKSMELIAEGVADIAEIAVQTGFSDRYHLGKDFKKHFGLTPFQYRRIARRAPQADFLAQVAERLSRSQFMRALEIVEEGLKISPSSIIREQLQHQKGLCLQALGRTAEAMAEWNALAGTSCGHQAGIERCRQFFLSDEISPALKMLRTLFTEANENQKREVVHLWMDHVSALCIERRPQPLRRYLDMRKELFPHDLRSMPLTANLLRAIGEDEEALLHCVELPAACFLALRRTGRIDEAIERFGAHAPGANIAHTLLCCGRHEEVLAVRPENPIKAARALTALGRTEEAIERYPEYSISAYFAMGRYKELLKRFPEETAENIERIYALHALGRTSELREYPTQYAWRWATAQLYSDPEAILNTGIPEVQDALPQARTLLALRALRENNRDKAEEMLAKIHCIRSPDIWWEHHTSTELLLVPVILGLMGHREHMLADIADIITRHQFRNRQILWHDAGYLDGSITQAEYHNQPSHEEMPIRFTFIQALAHDINGRNDQARNLYTEFLETSQPYGTDNLIRHRFAEWRLQAF